MKGVGDSGGAALAPSGVRRTSWAWLLAAASTAYAFDALEQRAADGDAFFRNLQALFFLLGAVISFVWALLKLQDKARWVHRPACFAAAGLYATLGAASFLWLPLAPAASNPHFFLQHLCIVAVLPVLCGRSPEEGLPLLLTVITPAHLALDAAWQLRVSGGASTHTCAAASAAEATMGQQQGGLWGAALAGTPLLQSCAADGLPWLAAAARAAAALLSRGAAAVAALLALLLLVSLFSEDPREAAALAHAEQRRQRQAEQQQRARGGAAAASMHTSPWTWQSPIEVFRSARRLMRAKWTQTGAAELTAWLWRPLSAAVICVQVVRLAKGASSHPVEVLMALVMGIGAGSMDGKDAAQAWLSQLTAMTELAHDLVPSHVAEMILYHQRIPSHQQSPTGDKAKASGGGGGTRPSHSSSNSFSTASPLAQRQRHHHHSHADSLSACPPSTVQGLLDRSQSAGHAPVVRSGGPAAAACSQPRRSRSSYSGPLPPAVRTAPAHPAACLLNTAPAAVLDVAVDAPMELGGEEADAVASQLFGSAERQEGSDGDRGCDGEAGGQLAAALQAAAWPHSCENSAEAEFLQSSGGAAIQSSQQNAAAARLGRAGIWPETLDGKEGAPGSDGHAATAAGLAEGDSRRLVRGNGSGNSNGSGVRATRFAVHLEAKDGVGPSAAEQQQQHHHHHHQHAVGSASVDSGTRLSPPTCRNFSTRSLSAAGGLPPASLPPHRSVTTAIMAPEEGAWELGGKAQAPPGLLAFSHSAVTVLFADIVGFTTLSKSLEPFQVFQFLNELYARYDAVVDSFNVYKVETIGDCYMCATGLLREDPDHAAQMVRFAKEMQRQAAQVLMPDGSGHHVRVRVGIHSGPLLSGVIGRIRRRYCVVGSTVNLASRMESTGIPGRVHISGDTHALVRHLGDEFAWECRGEVGVKGVGSMVTYLLAQQGEQEWEEERAGGAERDVVDEWVDLR